MEIFFKTKKLAKILNNKKLIEKNFGGSAKKIMMRLDDLKAVNNLKDAMNLPGRHHELKGKRKGEFACDLEHPFRLIYRPANVPLPTDENGALIYEKVTSIEIIEITDYH